MFQIELKTELSSLQRKTYIKEGCVTEKRFISPRPLQLKINFPSGTDVGDYSSLSVKAKLIKKNQDGTLDEIFQLQGETEQTINSDVVYFNKMYILESSKKSLFSIRFCLYKEGTVISEVDSTPFQVLSNQKNLRPQKITAKYAIEDNGDVKIMVYGDFARLFNKRTLLNGKIDDDLLSVFLYDNKYIILRGRIGEKKSGMLSLLLKKKTSGSDEQKDICYIQFK